jgi:3-hydroxyisobutyrate dehydrogenase
MSAGRIAFLGLGAMGAPMAATLAAKGCDVVGFDVAAPARARAAVRLPVAESFAAAVDGAETVVTMLREGVEVDDAWRAALSLAAPGALFIDCSTIDVATSRALHAAARDAGMRALDAPVSGGVAGARAGTLTFMCGGAEETFADAYPLLAKMGARIFHCGGPGLGHAAKLCNNLMLGVAMSATAEAFALAARLGLPAEALFEVAGASSGQSWSLSRYCPVAGLTPGAPANDAYRAGFATRLMLKDLRLAERAAATSGVEAQMCAAAAKLYARYAAAGGAEKDFSGIFEMLTGTPATPASPE